MQEKYKSILIISHYFSPEAGAAPTRLDSLVKFYLKKGLQVEVLAPMPNYPLGRIFPSFRRKFYDCEKSKNLTIHRFWVFAGQGKAWQRLFCFLSFAITACFGIFVCRRPNIIFVNSGPLFVSLPTQFLSFCWNVPYIFNVADLWPRSVEHLQGLGGKLFYRFAISLEKLSYKRALYVNAITDGVRDILINEKKIPQEKLLFLPNGVDTNLFFPQAKDKNLINKLQLSNKVVFIYPGNHGYAHALEYLIEAVRILKEQKTFKVLLIGGGSERQKLIMQARDLDQIQFLDPVSPQELTKYISVADVGLIHVRNSPLADETRPAKMFPMMAMAKPILYCGSGEGRHLIEKVKGGFCLNSGDEKALAQEILKIVQGIHESKQFSNELEKMGQKNYEYVKNNFDVEKLIFKWWSEVK